MKTLVLNVDFTPLTMVHAKRALVLASCKNMKVLAYYEDIVFKSEKQTHKVPAVILYHNYVYVPVNTRPSRRAILIRDKHTCQYCGIKLTRPNVTIDHVKPASWFKHRQDSNTWENMVGCCKKCNYKKDHRTPEEAGMKLLNKPKAPRGFLIHEQVPREWKDFI